MKIKTFRKIIILTVLFVTANFSLSAGGAGGFGYYMGSDLSFTLEYGAYTKSSEVGVSEGFGYWLNDGDIFGGFGIAIAFDSEDVYRGGYGGLMFGHDFTIGRFNLSLLGKIGVGGIGINENKLAQITASNPNYTDGYGELASYIDVCTLYFNPSVSVGYQVFDWMRVELNAGVGIVAKPDRANFWNDKKLWFPQMGILFSFGGFDNTSHKVPSRDNDNDFNDDWDF